MIRYALAIIGYAIAAFSLSAMIVTPFWNLYVTNFRTKELNKNR